MFNIVFTEVFVKYDFNPDILWMHLVFLNLERNNKYNNNNYYFNNIMDLENYSRQKSLAETLSKEWILGLYHSLDILDPFSNGPETTLTDYMFQEKRKEEDLLALKTVLTHRYNGSKTIYKNTMEDSLQPSETIMITRWTTEWQ